MNILLEPTDFEGQSRQNLDPHKVRLLFDGDNGLQQLSKGLKVLITHLGLDNFFFLALCPAADGGLETSIISDLSAAWSTTYEQHHFMKLDPTSRHCRDRLTPLLWWTEAELRGKESVSFIQQARQAGLCSGVSFPIHGAHGVWGMLNVSARDELLHSRERLEMCMPYGQMVGGYLLEAAIRGGKSNHSEPKRHLTKREEECLVWCSKGKTSWEIAKILGISERTVFFHLQNASRKLRASNRIQAVARAMPHIDWPMA